jgi:hypothetical protein
MRVGCSLRSFRALMLLLSLSWPFPFSFSFLVQSLFGLLKLLVNAHQACAGGEADAETHDHCRAGPFFLSSQHESGRSAR